MKWELQDTKLWGNDFIILYIFIFTNITCRLCIEEKLSVLKTQIRHKLLLKDVFEASVVDLTLQSIVHSQLQTHFKPYNGIFNYSEDVHHKHCNRTKEVFFYIMNICAWIENLHSFYYRENLSYNKYAHP